MLLTSDKQLELGKLTVSALQTAKNGSLFAVLLFKGVN
jgi:hypothetical protein